MPQDDLSHITKVPQNSLAGTYCNRYPNEHLLEFLQFGY